MRLEYLSLCVAGLVGLAAAVPIVPNQNATQTSLERRLSGEEPWHNSVGAQLEGLASCYARCFIEQNKYMHTDMAYFSFADFCGPYWKAVTTWEGGRVRDCALGACNEIPCPVHHVNPVDCDVPHFVMEARTKWLKEKCKGIREVKVYGERHGTVLNSGGNSWYAVLNGDIQLPENGSARRL